MKSLVLKRITLLLVLLSLLQGACFWKKKKPLEEKIFEVYGTVESIDKTSLRVALRKGEKQEFAMVDSSIKGSDFKPGAFVHVYYKIRNDQKEVTMVVEKVDY